MLRPRIALLGGPVFFALWFIAAQILFFAVGGDTAESTLPGPAEFPDVVLANESGMYLGATLLVFAGIALLWFGVGLKARVGSGNGIDMVIVVGTTAVAMLLIIEAGLAAASVAIAPETPEMSWAVNQLSGDIGFENFMSTLLGAATLTGVIVATSRDMIRRWFWWLTVVFASVLTVTGTLEGLGVVPNGRFSIFFGLWAFIAGFALLANPKAADLTRL